MIILNIDSNMCKKSLWDDKRWGHVHIVNESTHFGWIRYRISSDLGMYICDSYKLLSAYHSKFGPSWRHQIETFSALLALCAGNSPVIGEFPAQRPVTQSFDVSFDLRMDKRLSKQSWGWWFETPSRSLWRQCNAQHKPVRTSSIIVPGIHFDDVYSDIKHWHARKRTWNVSKDIIRWVKEIIITGII